MSATHQEDALQGALSQGLLGGEGVPLALMFDLGAFRRAMGELKSAFPGHFLHTLAVKSNPTLAVMEFAKNEGDMGFEAASMGELVQAMRTGAQPATVVFDSPVKTKAELRCALDHGVHINVDNLQELDRLATMMKEREHRQGPNSTQWLGLRINPQVGAGSIVTHSTSTATSKFGIPLQDQRQEILQAYSTHPWLNAVHVHVGSQGISVSLAVAGIRAVVDLAQAINQQAGRQQIVCMDIGGGLAVNFSSACIPYGFAHYAQDLRRAVPELFIGAFHVITEFGRSVVSKAGWFASRVEYTKVCGGRHIAAQHAGADLCIRTVYHADKWPLRVAVLDSRGQPSTEPEEAWAEWDIAGPCCIAGDIIAHQRRLPMITPGDWLVVADVGGYYHASYSRYNCRQAPPVIGYEVGATGIVAFRVLQRAETVEESLRMFSVTS